MLTFYCKLIVYPYAMQAVNIKHSAKQFGPLVCLGLYWGKHTERLGLPCIDTIHNYSYNTVYLAVTVVSFILFNEDTIY